MMKTDELIIYRNFKYQELFAAMEGSFSAVLDIAPGTGAPVVYMTSEITPEGLMAV